MKYKKKKQGSFRYHIFLKGFFGLSFLVFIFAIKFQAFAKEFEYFKITKYLNSIRTLQSEFIQESSSGQISTGEFFLKKPGKFRFSYDPPSELQVVSYLQAILIFDPKNKRTGPLTYPISRSPFKYMLEDKFEVDIESLGEVTIEAKTLYIKLHPGKGEKNNLTLTFENNPFKLTGWELENDFGEITKVYLNNLRINEFVSDEIFKLDKDYDKLKK